jgi:acyl-coenzyme A thioesterase PaaI-like protein
MPVTSTEEQRRREHVLAPLGFWITPEGESMVGRAVVTPVMHAPGTGVLRTGILGAWTDLVTGMVALEQTFPQIPVTLDLDVHLFEQPPSTGTIEMAARALKVGRSVAVFEVELRAEGDLFGVGTSKFVTVPDPTLRMATMPTMERPPHDELLAVPFAVHAGIEVLEPGVASVPNAPGSRNAVNTLNGALLAVVVEEAALSLTPGESLALLDLHYLQPVRVGPAVARADVRNGLGRVEVRDAGADGRLAVVATTRTFGPA